MAAALMGLLDPELENFGTIGSWARMLMWDPGLGVLRWERWKCLNVSWMDPGERYIEKGTNIECRMRFRSRWNLE